MDLSTMIKCTAVLYYLATIFVRETQCVTVRPYCFDTVSGYRATFSLRKDGSNDNDIVGLQAYDASINPVTGTPSAVSGADCNTSTTIPGNNKVYSMSFTFSSSSSACGSVGTTVQIRAEGTSQFWEFSCGGNGLPNTVTDFISASGAPDFHHHLPNPFDVRFQAFEADGANSPATSVHFGQDIKLRLIYNVGEIETGPDNWGTLFHTGFIPHATATDLIIQIVTPGLGTKVHITGELAGNVIDSWVSVKRDNAREVKIPAAYKETDATKSDWTIQSRGIRIEAMHDRIGVRVISRNGAGSSFIVSPDDILGTEYNAISLHGDQSEDGEVLVVATKDGTSVDIVYNNFSPRAGLDVNGIDADTGISTDNIILNEYDVLHIRCDYACYQIKILSDEPVAVVFGADNKAHFDDTGNAGHASTQLLPVVNYDDDFVLVHITTNDKRYIAQNEDPTITAPANYDDFYGDGQTYSAFPFVTTNNSEYRLLLPVGLYLHQEAGDAAYDPYIFPMPSVDQWGAFNYFYVKEEVTYSLVVVGRISEVANIQFKTGSVTTNLVGSTLGEQPGFSTTILRGETDQPCKRIRLVDGPSENSGHVEVYHDNEWRPTCGLTYADQTMEAEADVVCRQLGYSDGVSWYEMYSFFGDRTNPNFWLDFLVCDGTESSLEECDHQGWGYHACSGDILFTVTCAGTRTCGTIQKPSKYERYDFDITVTDTSPYLDEGLIEFIGGNSWNTFLMIIQEEHGSYRNGYLPFGVRYPSSNPCVPTSPVRPGDLNNNDCDKYTDEEVQNGKDDDGDGLVDEDVALDLVSPATGIFVEDLYLCSDEMCSSSIKIHTSGCNDDPLGDDSHLGIGPFQHKTNLAEEFDNYYVIETSAFNAFIDDRDDNVLYFMVTYGICLGDLTRCENSCLTVAKRSTDEVRNGVTLAIPVIRNSTHATPKGARQGNVGGQRKPHPCSNNPVYWVTMSLLLCILLIEVIATVFFSYKWYQFRRLMHN